jgi:hypothetical protein
MSQKAKDGQSREANSHFGDHQRCDRYAYIVDHDPDRSYVPTGQVPSAGVGDISETGSCAFWQDIAEGYNDPSAYDGGGETTALDKSQNLGNQAP